MASEDSDELVPGLPMIHRLRDRRDLDKTLASPMSISGDDLHTPRERLEIVALGCSQRMLLEERDYRLQQVPSASNGVLAEVLPMVVVSTVDVDTPDAEEALKLLETGAAPLALSYDEPVKHLVAGRVAFSPRAM